MSCLCGQNGVLNSYWSDSRLFTLIIRDSASGDAGAQVLQGC